jgi:hypothetical protein
LNNFSWLPGEAVNGFVGSPELTRLYLVVTARRLMEIGVDRSLSALVDFAGHTAEGVLENVEHKGSIGFFPDNDI